MSRAWDKSGFEPDYDLPHTSQMQPLSYERVVASQAIYEFMHDMRPAAYLLDQQCWKHYVTPHRICWF